MTLIATDTMSFDLDSLSDPGVTEIATIYDLAGERPAILLAMREKMLSSSYVELSAIFATLRTVAATHGAP